MAKLLTDELWARVAPLLPPEPPKPKGGRPRVPDRACRALGAPGILFVLKTGIAWGDLPAELGCGSAVTCWRRLRAWQAAGVWERLPRVLLDELGEAGQIDWTRASVDTGTVPAPGGRKNRQRSHQSGERPGGVRHQALPDRRGARHPLAILQSGATPTRARAWKP